MTRTRQFLRASAGLATAAVVLATAACSADPGQLAAEQTSSVASPGRSAAPSSSVPAPPPGSTTTIPDTPAGHQLEWFLAAADSLPISTQEARAHFTQRFLTLARGAFRLAGE